MSRIFKSVNFESNKSVTIRVTEFARLPVDHQVTEVEAPDGFEAEAIANGDAETALLAEAQAHVEMMLNQAQLQADNLEKEAKEAGWKAGYEEARQEVETEMGEALNTAHALAKATVEAKDQFLEENQAEVGRLAIAIAEKIIGKELTINPKTIADIVANTITAAKIQGACCIRINPQDHEILGPMWDAIPSMQQPSDSWELIPDKRIKRGGCLIEIDGGTVDARLETQLTQISQAFEDLEQNQTENA